MGYFGREKMSMSLGAVRFWAGLAARGVLYLSMLFVLWSVMLQPSPRAMGAFPLEAVAAEAHADEVPNLSLTPGVAVPGLTAAKVCRTKWGKDARHVTEAMKREVFAAYGMSGNDDPRCAPAAGSKQRCEIDHLISRELGGADDVKNLWPQPYAGRWNAHLKDKLENRLHAELCAGRLTLPQAQEAIARDWRVVYRRYYGAP